MQIHAVWVYLAGHDEIGDEAIEERVDVGLMPEIPRVARRAWRDVNAFGWRVERLLVLPLLIVHLGGSAAAAMHGDVETSSMLWLLAADHVKEPHGGPAGVHDTAGDLLGSTLTLCFLIRGPRAAPHVLRLSAGERGFG
jgi:hypothetical protein